MSGHGGGNSGYVEYKFAHEVGTPFARLSFHDAGITIADLKILIAQRSGLQREFARTVDLNISLADSVSKSEQVLDTAPFIQDDSYYVPSGSRVLVRRALWRPRTAGESIQHHAESNLASLEEREKRKPSVRRFQEHAQEHPEQICRMCSSQLKSPVIVHCETGCNAPVCASCGVQCTKECPQCRRQVISAHPSASAVDHSNLVKSEEDRYGNFPNRRNNDVSRSPERAQGSVKPEIKYSPGSRGTRQIYEFDPESDLWRPRPSDPLLYLCPFKSLEELLSQMPFLSRGDFEIVRQLQALTRQLLLKHKMNPSL